jgi:hypothetical protein
MHPTAGRRETRSCRDEVCRITLYLVRGSGLKTRTSEQRDKAPWTLAASVPQAGIDYGAWSRHRGNPHAYPPIWRGFWVGGCGRRAAREWVIWVAAIFGAS